jgi:epoxyqueuosine reductase
LMSLQDLKNQIPQWAEALGFSATGFVKLDRSDHEAHLLRWLRRDHHGSMDYMARNVDLRVDPAGLLPGSLSAITVRMDYLPVSEMAKIEGTLAAPSQAYVARYALGRDYHKVIRRRLTQLATQINDAALALGITDCVTRACTDSAPILEKRFAEQSGLGWIGKNTLLLNQKRGSWFFIGELLTNLPFSTPTETSANHCGSCTRCLDVCPTKAFVGPFELDAKRCISYLTIESKAAIPEPLRVAMGNRIFGCDDCQMVCPWNKFAAASVDPVFEPRPDFEQAALTTLFAWSEATFLEKTQGSAIRRTGYSGWLRNISVALGNADYDPEILASLQAKRPSTNLMVQEHIDWAIQQQVLKRDAGGPRSTS